MAPAATTANTTNDCLMYRFTISSLSLETE
jgi:hypothetical protein